MMMKEKLEKQLQDILWGTMEILPHNLLEEKVRHSLKTGVPLKIKLGIDPTSPDIHLGHTVLFQKLRIFQQWGHIIQVVIGDFTAQIGDPSGRSQTRQQLSIVAVKENAQTYMDQLFKRLNRHQTEVHYNSQWLNALSFSDVTNLAAKCTVARMLERDDFANRYHSGQAISVHEFLYPLMQGYDSVVLDSDIEIGGTDQIFNLLMGRQLQREFGKPEQVILTMPLIEGLDGVKKMSKSLNNYIGVTESPHEMYGKVMSLPDELILKYFTLVTDLNHKECAEIEKNLTSGQWHPMKMKKRLAFTLVQMYHDESKADEAAKRFTTVFQQRSLPDDLEEFLMPNDSDSVWIVQLLSDSGLVTSNSEARRLITQRAVRIDGECIENVHYQVQWRDGMVLQVGKRRIVRLRGK